MLAGTLNTHLVSGDALKYQMLPPLANIPSDTIWLELYDRTLRWSEGNDGLGGLGWSALSPVEGIGRPRSSVLETQADFLRGAVPEVIRTE